VKSVPPWLFLIALLSMAGGKSFAQGTLFTLLTNGPTANRLNLVFLAEGYTNGQTAQFTNDARGVLQRMLATPPYLEYTNYCNAFAIFVASDERGSDHPSGNVFRNTYFNSTYDSYGTTYLVTIPPNDRDNNYANGRGKVDALLQSLLPDYDIALLLVNDPAYGGSGGPVSVASTNPSSAEIAVHEIGHSFGGLGDEYSTAYPGYPDIEEPNTTTQTNRAQIKWNAWIQMATPVPTPDNATYQLVVGLFEGAHYHATGWFRPKRNCKMRALNTAFCEVCGEALVSSIYNRLDPIDSVSPATNALVSITNALAVTFSVARLRPSTHQLGVQWYVTNALRSGATNSTLTMTAWDLAAGTNVVRVEVVDGTALVRTDPQQLLRANRAWHVNAIHLQPALAISRMGNEVSVTWSALATGFRLESSLSPNASGTWTSLGMISNQASAVFGITANEQYFRLQRP